MDNTLKLIATFLYDTPLYGIVAKGKLPKRPLTIASHPAPIPLINELLPQGIKIGEVLHMKSTSEAAAAVAAGKVDLALTTENAARLHKLDFISSTRPISMLWSVFNFEQNITPELLLD